MNDHKITRRRMLAYIASGGVAAGAGLLGCGRGTGSLQPPPSDSTVLDLVVYGGTPAGIMAAVAAARAGMQVTLVEPTNHVGGMLSSGLGQTDSLYKKYIGGLTAQFYSQIGAYYGTPDSPGYNFEPHVAELIFNRLISAAQVTLLTGSGLSAMIISGQQIATISLTDGTVLAAQTWVDASYEGDLMKAAGVSYQVGREPVAQYQEPHAGWAAKTLVTNVSPVQADGSLVPDIHDNPMETPGQGDAKIMAYSYRACLTTDPANMAPFPQPPNYDPGRYIGLARSIANNNITELGKIVAIVPTINHKFDLLRSENPFSVNLVGGGWAYPDATAAARAAIVEDHYNYVAGWLYYVANDPSVPSNIRSEMRKYGLAKDEFTDNGNWPYQLYIREARRMTGQYVMTESDITTDITKTDSIAIGTWYGDSHPCDSYSSVPIASGTAGAVVNVDGELDVSGPAYEVPYRSLLPQASQAANLAVVCCPSSSHVGFSSLRVEPTFMMLGEAAGAAASLCVQNSVGFSEVSVPSLQAILTSNGGIVSL